MDARLNLGQSEEIARLTNTPQAQHPAPKLQAVKPALHAPEAYAQRMAELAAPPSTAALQHITTPEAEGKFDDLMEQKKIWGHGHRNVLEPDEDGQCFRKQSYETCLRRVGR